MKITNISNQKIAVVLREKQPVDLKPGESVEGDVTNIDQIRKRVRIGENLTEVMPSKGLLNG